MLSDDQTVPVAMPARRPYARWWAGPSRCGGLLGPVHIDSRAGHAHSDESEISVNGSRIGRRPM